MGNQRVHRRSAREPGGDSGSSADVAGAKRRLSRSYLRSPAEEGASHRASPTWIQIEEGRLIEGEIEDGELGPVLLANDGEWMLFESEEAAGVRARRFMADLSRQDPEEFANLVGGSEVLLGWTTGIPAGPGTEKVTSLRKYLDLWLTDFASLYDINGAGSLIKACSASLRKRLGFHPGIAYRRN